MTVVDLQDHFGLQNYWGGQTITLQSHHFSDGKSSLTAVASSLVPCLLILYSSDEGYWALKVDSVPKIIDIPMSSIYPISSTHPRPISDLAQYMALVTVHSSAQHGSEPIFLLDLQRIQPNSRL